MELPTPCIEGHILKRYKRFLADVELEGGEIVTAHVANTGSMKTCWEPGQKVRLSHYPHSKRKLPYSLEMTHNGKSWIGVNTSRTNQLAKEAIQNGTVEELQGHKHLVPEVKIGTSRLDFLLHDGELPSRPGTFKNPCFVEVKNVTLLGEHNLGLFPDAVSIRGQKHLRQLIQLARENTRAVMLYIVNRQDVHAFAPAQHIDPDYAKLVVEANHAKVEILAYQCHLTQSKIFVQRPLPVKLPKL